MTFDWALVQKAIPLLGTGLLTTVKICLLAMLLGIALGGALGLGSLSRWKPLRWAVMAYVDFIRGTPLLVQIFLVYFALPVVGVNLPEFWAGVIALGLNAAGFIAEIVSFLNTELARLKADGTIYKLQEKWFGFRMTLADKIPTFS